MTLKKTDPRKAARPGKSRKPVGELHPRHIDQRLSKVAARVKAGDCIEDAWELFRLQYFPGWRHTTVAGLLGAWSQRQGIKARFEVRKDRDHDLNIIFIVLTAR
jgi:hypothetical protein